MNKNIYRKDYIDNICPQCKKQGTEIDSLGELWCCFCECVLGYNVSALKNGIISEKITNDIDNFNKN